MLKNSLKIATGTILVASLSFAQTDAKPQSQPSKLDSWWEYSSYQHEDTDRFLMHYNIEAGYEKGSGNIDETSYGYNLSAQFRQNHFTGTLFYNRVKSDMVAYANIDDKTGTKIKDENYDRGGNILYDVNNKVYAEIGYINSKNTTFDIYNQERLYAGVGYHVLSTDAHHLTAYVARGTEDTSYGILPTYPSGSTDAYLYILDYSWDINEGMNISTSYESFMADKNMRDSSAFNVSFFIALSEEIYLSVSYTDIYKESQKISNRFTNSKKTSVGLGVSF